MDLGLAFTFPFQDENWLQKILIAGLIMLIPFLGWLAVFWMGPGNRTSCRAPIPRSTFRLG